MNYSIDTSAILHAWKRSYPPEHFPLLWDKIDRLINKGQLRAIEEVLVELEKQDDEVFKWVRERKGTMIVPIDSNIQGAVQTILKGHKKLVNTRKSRSQADPFVIALAQITGSTVVTNERPTGNLARPNIPDVCTALDVRWINILELIREQGWVF